MKKINLNDYGILIKNKKDAEEFAIQALKEFENDEEFNFYGEKESLTIEEGWLNECEYDWDLNDDEEMEVFKTIHKLYYIYSIYMDSMEFLIFVDPDLNNYFKYLTPFLKWKTQ